MGEVKEKHWYELGEPKACFCSMTYNIDCVFDKPFS